MCTSGKLGACSFEACGVYVLREGVREVQLCRDPLEVSRSIIPALSADLGGYIDMSMLGRYKSSLGDLDDCLIAFIDGR